MNFGSVRLLSHYYFATKANGRQTVANSQEVNAKSEWKKQTERKSTVCDSANTKQAGRVFGGGFGELERHSSEFSDFLAV